MPEGSRPRGRILIVEDEAYVRSSLGEMLSSRGFDVELAESPDAAVAILDRAPVDVVLSDLRMPGGGGLGLLRRVRSSSPRTPVVILTGFGTIASAVECVREGASDYILKPADPDALEVALERALSTSALAREVRYLRRPRETPSVDEMPVGSSGAWLKVMETLRAAAPTDSTVLLIGESGTGKEVIARLIHRLSARSRGPFVGVNCAATPLEMWESEFFGHRRGSFTGATNDREGRFRTAHEGTLFMDEIGTMPAPAQAKLLRVLQEGEFDRLGDTRPTRVNVRVVAATNSDLTAEIAAGRFRSDLYYRLNVMRVDVPPLRERLDDIPALASRFVAEISARIGRPTPGIAPTVIEDMKAWHWPGNVRELRNVIERALILNDGPLLDSVDLDPDHPSAVTGSPAAAMPATLNLRAALGEREREVVIEALRRANSVRKDAAELLGIDQRNLAYYFRKHGIDPDNLPE